MQVEGDQNSTPPMAPPADSADDKYAALLSKLQRDINRMQDSDRNTRRRGIQKVLEDIPWAAASKSKGGAGTKKAIRQLLGSHILPVILGLDLLATNESSGSCGTFRVVSAGLLADPVEKCREVALTLIKSMLTNVTGLKTSVLCAVVQALAARVSESPFPETSEELRLLVVENLHSALNYALAMHAKSQAKGQAQAADGDADGEGAVESLSLSASASTLTETPVPVPCRIEESPDFKSLVEKCLAAAVRAQHDSFPEVKRASSELAFDLAVCAPTLVRLHFKTLAIGLTLNCNHQHSKTRSVALRALGQALSVVTGEFDSVMGSLELEGAAAPMDKASIVAVASGLGGGSGGAGKQLNILLLLARLVSDGNASVRKMLAMQMGLVLQVRFQRYAGLVDSAAELQTVVQLLLLLGDDIDDVRTAALASLEGCLKCWRGSADAGVGTGAGGGPRFDDNAHIVDGEAALKQSAANAQQDSHTHTRMRRADSDADLYAPRHFIRSHAAGLCSHLLRGVADWTAAAQRRYLNGLEKFLLLGGQATVLEVLPQLLQSLGTPCRDDESATRAAAEQCCSRIGCLLSDDPSAAISLLVPRLAGITAGGGGDTASLRSKAVLQLTHVLKGLRYTALMEDTSMKVEGSGSSSAAAAAGALVGRGEFLDSFPVLVAPTRLLPLDSQNVSHVAAIIAALGAPELYEFREPYMREALLLLVRSLIDAFPHVRSDSQSECTLLLSLLYLQGRCAGETDLVPEAARSQMHKLANPAGAGADGADAPAASASPAASAAMFARHFPTMLDSIMTSSIRAQRLVGAADALDKIAWPADSVVKTAFEVLVRSAPVEAWKHHETILRVITPQVQLPPITERDTPEDHLETYKAQRGDTDAAADVHNASTRLALMALLETWVRTGSQNWTAGGHLGEAASHIIKKIVCGNLVWRVGRVEATVRKVTLAVAHALLRAGAVKPAILYETAGELVPRITSQMDDNETSVRHIAALCLSVIFERLKGAFGYQAVSELYPMLIKRLDDSNDEVRVQACRALGSFMAASSPGAYAGTALDYTLDQLFIHLDDPDPAIQSVVYDVIMIGTSINKDLVWKKAHENLATHRNTAMCDRLIRDMKA